MKKMKVLFHQLPQPGFAENHDCDVSLTSLIIFRSWSQHFQMVSFVQEEVSI